jgi:hypothetical protein
MSIFHSTLSNLISSANVLVLGVSGVKLGLGHVGIG